MPDLALLRWALATRVRSLVAVTLIFIVCPALVMAGLAEYASVTLRVCDWTIATAFMITSIALGVESYAASRRIPAPILPIQPPSLSVVVAAYLPNEEDIIIETLRHILRRLDVWAPRMQIVLTYNTPTQLNVETVLARLGATAVQIQTLKVDGSTSKAENIRAALPLLTGEMTVLLDADHHPAPDAPARAWRWLTAGYDIVQGRCIVRNPLDSFQSRLVAIDFEQMYALSHQGRSMLADTAIFGGTNGWWRTSVLQKVGMDPRMLTEDIDSATRAILGGYKLIHDRSVVSTELSTMSPRAWWNQRLRWAQGWHQVLLRRRHQMWRTPYLTSFQRWYWAYMLVWGGVFPIIGIAASSALIAAALTRHRFELDPYLVFTTIVVLTVMVGRTWVTWRVASPSTRRIGIRWMWIYALLGPVYETLKTLVALTAILREAAAIDEWVVTSRTAQPKPVERLEDGRSATVVR